MAKVEHKYTNAEVIQLANGLMNGVDSFQKKKHKLPIPI